MKVVILGGTGILSTSISQKCIEKSFEVYNFKRSQGGVQENVKIILGDRNNKADLRKVLKVKPDIIIDMLCFDEEAAKLSAEVFKNEISQYIFCSTSCVYTPVKGAASLVEESATEPYTEYGNSKLSAEKVFRESEKKKYFNVTIFRPGSVFNDRFVVNHLTMNGFDVLARMKKNMDVVLSDGGTQHFQLCHSSNIGAAFSGACGNELCFGNTYNIAGEEAYTWNDIYRIEKEILGSKSQIIYMDSDKLLAKGKDKLSFMETVTAYDWNHNTKKLHAHIEDYSYKANFEKSIEKIIKQKYQSLDEASCEDDLYNLILDI